MGTGISGTGFGSILKFTFKALALSLALTAITHAAQTNLAVTVRHAPIINGDALIEGSVQQLLGENVTLNGGATLTGDLLVPGEPALSIHGQPTFAGTITGAASATPSGYRVTLNGDCSLKNLRTRTAPVTLIIRPVNDPPVAISETNTADIQCS
jgi:hypothetical protein